MSAVFVKGFDFGTNEDDIKKHFSSVGTIKDLYFQSKDACVVTYAKASDATRAVDELQETTMQGQSRYVLVKLDDRESNGESSGKGKGKGKGKSKWSEVGSQASGRTVFASGFDVDTDDAAVREHFGEIGEIETLHFQSKFSAVITFTSTASAEKAVSDLDGSTMSGQSRYVAVRLDRDSDEGKGKGKGKGKDKGKGKGKGSGKHSENGGEENDGRAVVVMGFDFGTDEATLKGHFNKVGAIDTLYFQSKSSAVITFVKEASAERALAELDGTTMKGQSRYVGVKLDEPDRKGRKGSGKSWGKGK
jgi:RNA recognition motif-containing protein